MGIGSEGEGANGCGSLQQVLPRPQRMPDGLVHCRKAIAGPVAAQW